MDRARQRGRKPGSETASERRAVSPGKHTLTERLPGVGASPPVQRSPSSHAIAEPPHIASLFGGPLARRVTGGDATEPDTAGQDPVRMGRAPDHRAADTDVHAAASRGTAGSGGPLPFRDRIQALFGSHDISHIRAHTDAAAAEASATIGAKAFATGHHVAFREPPSLHTAAHEAAHVIQQRAGVQLAGGVGAVGDRYEQHADAVADRVVQGRSAEDLLNAEVGEPAAADPAIAVNVQRVVEGSPGEYYSSLDRSRTFANHDDAVAHDLSLGQGDARVEQHEKADEEIAKKRGGREQGRNADVRAVGSSHINPARKSEVDSATHKLAFEQTRAARELLRAPGPAVRQQLSDAAGRLVQIIEAPGGDQHVAALGARLLGDEGIMKGRSTLDMKRALHRVHRYPELASSMDRAAVVELMGGVGALFADTGATTGMGSRGKQQESKLREYLRQKIPGIDETIAAAKEFGDSAVVGPKKKAERTRPSSELVERCGVHNTGDAADRSLGIPNSESLAHVSFQVAHIDPDKVSRTTEPLAGHMSGSPTEALATWGALLGEKQSFNEAADKTAHLAAKDPDYTQKHAFHDSGPEAEAKSARLAACTAYLIACGFHTSVEVMESALKFSGQNPRPAMIGADQDASDSFGHGAATALIHDLHRHHTEGSKARL
jgi:hypothetical protein